MNLLLSVISNTSILILIFVFSTSPTANFLVWVLRIKVKVRLEHYQNFIINCFFISIILYEAARLDLNLQYASKAIFITMLFSLILQWKQNKFHIQSIKKLKSLIIVFVASTWAIFPMILKISQNGMTLGLGSIGNNDVINYALMSKDFLSNGFNDGGNIANVNLGFNNHFLQHQTANSFITVISSVSGLESWKILTAIAGAVIAIGIHSLSSLVQNLFQINNRLISNTFGSIVFLSPLMSYVTGNYFLAQLIAIPITIEMLRIFLNIGKSVKYSTEDYVLLPVTISLCIFAYPVFLIPWVAVCFMVAFFLLILRKVVPTKKFINITILLISLGFVLAFDYLIVAFRLGKMQGETSFGWELSPLNPFSTLVSSDSLGKSIGDFYTFVAWLIFLVIFAILFAVSEIDIIMKKFLLLYVAINLFLVLVVFAFKSQSMSSYQVWKLQSFLFPILLVMLLSVAYKSRKSGKIIVAFIGFFALLAPLQLWEKSLISRDLVINSEMEALASNPKLAKLAAVNIDLNPYFENMAVATLLDNQRKYIKGVQYYPSINSDSACTLTRVNNRNYEFIEPLSIHYALAPSVDGTCVPENLRPNVDVLPASTKVYFNNAGLGVKYFGIGWSTPEEWGTWASQEKSTLLFELDARKEMLVEFELNVLSYIPNDISVQTLKVYLNGVQVFKQEFNSSNPAKRVSFKGKVLPAGNTNEISFQVSPIYRPKDFGKSNDPRRLGLGVTSIYLKYQY
jgi:hypothetical protein